MNNWKCLEAQKISADDRGLAGGPFGSRLVSDDYVGQGVPVIRGKNVKGGRWIDGDFAYVTEQKSEDLSAHTAAPGDLVFTQRGTLGQVAIVPEGEYDLYVVSQSQMRLTPDTEKCDTNFLYYYFSAEEQQDRIENQAIQTGVPHINLGILEEFEVELPPLHVQRRISDILGALDDKIELNRRMNGTLEEMAQALYRHWFADFGPFQDREFRDTEELGPIPKGWEVGKLNDYCTVNRQTVNKDDPPDPIEYIKISGVNEGRVEETEEMPWDESPTRANRRVKDGDIVWSKVRPNREGYFLCLEPPENLVVSTGFATITPKQLPFSWVYLSLTNDDFVEHLTARATGAAYPSVTLDAFRDAEFAIPDNGTLEAFHDKVEPLFRLQRSNTVENETLAETRDYLLPKLVSGEIEVDVAQEVAEDTIDASA